MTESAVQVTQLSAGYFQDPLRFFARMREERPVTPVVMPDGSRTWLITRYADVRAALADPRLCKDWGGKMQPEGWSPDPVSGYLSTCTCSTWTRRTTPGCASS